LSKKQEWEPLLFVSLHFSHFSSLGSLCCFIILWQTYKDAKKYLTKVSEDLSSKMAHGFVLTSFLVLFCSNLVSEQLFSVWIWDNKRFNIVKYIQILQLHGLPVTKSYVAKGGEVLPISHQPFISKFLVSRAFDHNLGTKIFLSP